MRPVTLLLLWVLALSAPLASRPAAGAQGENRVTVETGSLLRKDPRLARKVSLDHRRIFLGELLDRLGAEARVRLEASDRLMPVSGQPLTVVVHDRPLWEVLEGLARLFDVPPDRWSWTVRERDGRSGYVLGHRLPPQAVAQARAEFVEQYHMDQQRRLGQFFALPPERRAALAAGDPLFQASNKPRSEGFFSFIRELSDTDLRAILRGRPLEIPTERLSPAQLTFVEEEYRLARVSYQRPEKLRLFNQDGTVYLELGQIGAHGVLGGIWLDQAIRERSVREWLGSGEDRRPLDQPVPPAGSRIPPEQLAIAGSTTDDTLYRLGKAARLNLLFEHARHVSSRTFARAEGLTGPLPEVLVRLEKFMGLIWKRRGDFYFFRAEDWARGGKGHLVGWPLWRDLRAAAGDAGYLRPEDWLRLADLGREQLEDVGREFPDAGQVLQFQVLLRLAAGMTPREREALARPEGSGWSDWSPATRRRFQVLFSGADVRQARALLQWQRETTPPRVRAYLGMGPVRPLEREFRPRRKPEEAVTRRPGSAAR